MSRSNPSEGQPHPCTRWFEWSSKNKCVKYYDKDKEENILVKLPFVFLLLDELNVIRGWNKKKNDGITSNEVRNLKTDIMHVRYFKSGLIASGLYEMVKEKVAANKGSFHKDLYIAYRNPETKKLEIGSLMLGGCSCSAWFDFTKKVGKQRVEIDGKKIQAHYAKALCISGFESGTSGDIEYNSPVYQLMEVKPETAKEAIELDRELQIYLSSYFSKNTPAPKISGDDAYQPSPEDNGIQSDPDEAPTPENEPEPEPEPENVDVPF